MSSLPKLLALALGLTLFGARPQATADVNHWNGPDLGGWNFAGNWTLGNAPSADRNESASINNGATVVLSSHAQTNIMGFLTIDTEVAGVTLGVTSDGSGGLRITNGGDLPNVATRETGAVIVGLEGEGRLTVRGGGILSGTSLSLGGADTSFITLGDNSGLVAKLDIDGAAMLRRTTTIIGPDVNFKVAGDLILGNAGTLIADIRDAASHSPIKTTQLATLNGEFHALYGGPVPSLGTTWSLIDADSVEGAFDVVNVSGMPTLPLGRAYRIVETAGGVNGRLVQLAVTFAFEADFDMDSDVDGADLNRWTNNFGKLAGATHGQGDADANGAVDGADFLVWQRQLGSTLAVVANVPAGNAVPEPAYLATQGLLLLLVTIRAARNPLKGPVKRAAAP